MLRSGVRYRKLAESSSSDSEDELASPKKRQVREFTSLDTLEARYPYLFSPKPALKVTFIPVEGTRYVLGET